MIWFKLEIICMKETRKLNRIKSQKQKKSKTSFSDAARTNSSDELTVN